MVRDEGLGWRQDNGNRSNQESKFDFLATRQQLGKMDGGQQKIQIVRTNQQSNLRCSCQSIFSLCWHHPSEWSLGNAFALSRFFDCRENVFFRPLHIPLTSHEFVVVLD